MPVLYKGPSFGSHASNITIVNIDDQSDVGVEVEAPDNSPCGFFPIIAEKGMSRNYVYFTGNNGYANYISMFGKGSLQKHGQGRITLEKHLENGGRAMVSRCVSDNDTLSNVIVKLGIKIIQEQQELDDGTLVYVDPQGNDTTDKGNGLNYAKMVSKAIVKTNYENVDDMKSTDDLAEHMRANQNTTDANNFTWLNAFAISAKGNGKFGNDISFYIANSSEEDLLFPLYKFTVEGNSATGLSELESFDLTSSYDVTRNGIGIFIEDILDEFSAHVDITMTDDFQDLLHRLIEPVIDDNKNLGATYENFYWMAQANDVNKISWVIYDAVDPDIKQLVTAVPLAGGTTSWSGNFSFEGVHGAEITTEFQKVFTGELSDDIYNTTLFPVDYIVDANYPNVIKDSIKSFIQKRFEISYIQDMGTSISNPAIMLAALDASDRNNYNIVTIPYNIRKYKASDTEASSNVTMAIVYNEMLVRHWNQHGYWTPMAGTEYGVVAVDRTKVYPMSDKDELARRKALYLDFYKNDMYLDSQVTSQKSTSAMSEFFNVLILNRIIKEMLEVLVTYKHTVDTANDISELQARGKRVLDQYAPYIDSYTYKVRFANQYEARFGILTDDLNITFNGTVKKNRFNITILPKIYPTGGE